MLKMSPENLIQEAQLLVDWKVNHYHITYDLY